MKKEDRYIISLITVIIVITGTILISSIILEPIQEKLERTCALYDMDYIYRNGQYCMDDDGTIHPIVTDCPPPIKRGTCEITFIKE